MRRMIPLLLGLAALVQGAQGGWIHAKAWLAGVLLERSWERVQDGAAESRPWPWADTWPVARLKFPRQGVDDIVLDGASGRVLAFAPGRLHGSARPGAEGACVIAGHRDTHFSVLEFLRVGDPIELEGVDGVRDTYVVVDLEVVDRDDRWAVAPHGGSELVLVTCWPFDTLIPGGPERYVVRARRVDRSDQGP